MRLHYTFPVLLALAFGLPAQPQPRLFGEVVDEKGNPIPGATVTTLRRDETLPLRLLQYRTTSNQRERTAETDARGRFSIEIDRTGLYGVFAAKGDDLHSAIVSPVVPGEILTLTAHPTHRRTGRVLDASTDGERQPAAGARVLVLLEAERRCSVYFDTTPYLAFEYARLHADESGQFDFVATRSAKTYLAARLDQRMTWRKPSVDPGPDSDLTLSLTRDRPIHGQVFDTSGKPLPDASVKIHAFGDFAPGTRTDAVGRFTVTPGKSTFWIVDSPHHRPTVLHIARDARHDRDTPLRISLDAGRRLTARLLRANGSPVAHATVLTVTAPSGEPRLTEVLVERRTDAEGRVSLHGITPRSPATAVVHLDGSWVRFCHVPWVGDQDLGDLRLDPTARIIGRLRGVDGAPAALVPVLLRPVSEGDDPVLGDTRLTHTDVGGRFEFRGLLAEECVVAAFSAESRLATARVTASRDPELVELILKLGETIRGVVRDEAGKPASTLR